MNYLSIFLVSVALGIDAFSVAVSIGLSGVKRRDMLIVSGIVTIFHILMPLLGLSIGNYLGKVAGPIAGTVGALVLISIGLNTIWGSLKDLGFVRTNGGQKHPAKGGVINIANPVSLVVMAISVSLDALTVGFGLGAVKVDLLLTVVTMGVVAGAMTILGVFFGQRLNRTFGEKAEIIGGLILVIIGLKLLFL